MASSTLSIGRIVAGVIGALFAVNGVLSVVVFFSGRIPRIWPLLVAPLFSFAVAALLLFVAAGSKPSENARKRFGRAVLWGLIVGFLSFLCGFVGPLILTPGSDQGPLLGFLTGPIGFVVGCLAGAAWPVPPHANGTPG